MTLLTGFDLCRAALAVDGISAPEQSVLNVLAIMANADAECWPPIGGPVGLTAKTKLSERAVQNATKALAAAGHITRNERPGRGITYIVHPRTGCTPAQDAPPQEARPAGGAPTPAPPAPKQPRTTIPKKAAPSRGARAARPKSDFHRLPSDWKPIRFTDGTAAREVVDRRGQVWAKAQLEDFRAWAANAEDKPGKGRKLDWQQAFSKWINEQDKKEPRDGRGQHRSGGGAGRKPDGFLNAINESRARRQASAGRPEDAGGVPGLARLGYDPAGGGADATGYDGPD